jgi:hypothetical protein
MKFKNLLFLIPLIFILGCEQYSSKSDKINFKPEKNIKILVLLLYTMMI